MLASKGIGLTDTHLAASSLAAPDTHLYVLLTGKRAELPSSCVFLRIFPQAAVKPGLR